MERMSQAIAQAKIRVNAVDGEADFRPGTVTTIGHSLAAGDFADLYSPRVAGWNNELSDEGVGYERPQGKFPVTGVEVDGGIGSLVHDVSRQRVRARAPRARCVAQQLNNAAQELQEHSHAICHY